MLVLLLLYPAINVPCVSATPFITLNGARKNVEEANFHAANILRFHCACNLITQTKMKNGKETVIKRTERI